MSQDTFLSAKEKMFTFSASSFALGRAAEDYLRSKNAVYMDFGYTAYINSEAMPAILSELLERSSGPANTAENDGGGNSGSNSNNDSDINAGKDLVAELQNRLAQSEDVRMRSAEESNRLASQVRSLSDEVAMLKEQTVNSANLVQALKAENQHLQSVAKAGAAALAAAVPPAGAGEAAAAAAVATTTASTDSSAKPKESYEKLHKEVAALRAQHIDALASLKVLEQENEELQKEVDQLRSQRAAAAAAPPTKARS